MKSIRARAHGWKGPGAFENVSVAKAKQMESEGIRVKSEAHAMSHLKKHHK